MPDYLEVPTLGVAENGIEKIFGIYPNPASELFTITHNSKKGDDISLMIYDILGNLMEQDKLTNQISQIDISAIPSGMYFVSLIENNSLLNTRKLVIK